MSAAGPPQRPRRAARALACLLAAAAAAGLTSCGAPRPAPRALAPARPAAARARGRGHGLAAAPRLRPSPAAPVAGPLPPPAPLEPFAAGAAPAAWHPAGRPVGGVRAVYETSLVPPGGGPPAGIAWMDTRLLSARLYSGSGSPGGGPYRYTAPVAPAQAASLVAAFNGGFKMKDARGGYYTEGRVIVALRPGAASLVIGDDGSVRIGAWDAGVAMTPGVASVRQELVLLVAGGVPTPQAASPDWQSWGSTCGASSCLPSVPGIEHQWRTGIGVSADGALVYAAGAGLDPLQLAWLLARAGAVTGMQLDINPNWPVLATYDPPAPGGLAAPANGSRLLAGAVQGPATFFEPSWSRDFITMSARPAPPRPAGMARPPRRA